MQKDFNRANSQLVCLHRALDTFCIDWERNFHYREYRVAQVLPKLGQFSLLVKLKAPVLACAFIRLAQF